MKVYYFPSIWNFQKAWKAYTGTGEKKVVLVRAWGKEGCYQLKEKRVFLWTAGVSRRRDTKGDCLYWCARQALDRAGVDFPFWLEEGLARYLSVYTTGFDPRLFQLETLPGRISIRLVKEVKAMSVDHSFNLRTPVLPFRLLMRTARSEVDVSWEGGKWQENDPSRRAAFCLESWGLVYLALEGGGLGGEAEPSLKRFRRYMRKCLTLPEAGRERLLGFAHFRKDLNGLEKVFLRFIVEGEAERRAWGQEEETRRLLLGRGKPFPKRGR